MSLSEDSDQVYDNPDLQQKKPWCSVMEPWGGGLARNRRTEYGGIDWETRNERREHENMRKRRVAKGRFVFPRLGCSLGCKDDGLNEIFCYDSFSSSRMQGIELPVMCTTYIHTNSTRALRNADRIKIEKKSRVVLESTRSSILLTWSAGKSRELYLLFKTPRVIRQLKNRTLWLLKRIAKEPGLLSEILSYISCWFQSSPCP